MATLARRSNARVSRAPSRPRRLARRVGASIARGARKAASGGLSRVKANTQKKALIAAPIGAAVGAVIQAKVPQIPVIQGVPPQLLIGGVAVLGGLLTKGKVSEALSLGGLGPLCAGVSDLALRFASGGTLAGEYSGGPYGYGSTQIAGEYDDL